MVGGVKKLNRKMMEVYHQVKREKGPEEAERVPVVCGRLPVTIGPQNFWFVSAAKKKKENHFQILILGPVHSRPDQFFQLWSHLLEYKVTSGSVVCLNQYFQVLPQSLPCPADRGGDTTQRGSGRVQT